MKRNFLLMLLLTLLPLAGWAADVVKVGNYDVTLSQKVVALESGAATAPTISLVKKGSATVATNPAIAGVYDSNLSDVTEINAVGDYFLKITADSKTLYVPFQVAQPSDKYDYIDSRASWEQSATTDGHALKQYYTKYPTEDLWNKTLQKSYYQLNSSDEKQACVPDWFGAIYAPGAKYPWLCPYISTTDATAPTAARIIFRYEGKNDVLPWGDTAFGTGTDNKTFGCASIPGELGEEFLAERSNSLMFTFNNGQVTSEVYWLPNASEENIGNGFTDNNVNPSNSITTTFDIAKFKMLLAPASNPFALNVTLDSYETTYNGTNTVAPILTVTYDNETAYLAGSANIPSEAPTYEVTILDKDGNEVDDFNAAGKYTIIVTCDDATAIAEYSVSKFTLSVGLGNLTKEYGEADPTEPVYAIVYSNVPAGDDIVIKGQTISRTSNETPNYAAELPGTQIQYTVYGDAYVEDNENYIVSVTSTSGYMMVVKKVVNDAEFMVEVEDDNLIYDAYKKEPAFHVYRRFVTGVDAVSGNPTYGEWDKTNDLAGQFDVTYAKNVDADAYGVPSLVGEAPNQQTVYEYFKEPADRATVTVAPKATSPYMELVDDASTTEVDETSKISATPFKIRQRQIVANDVSNVADQTFNNQVQEPDVTVSFQNANLNPATVTLAKFNGETGDYTITYGNDTKNKWVTDAAEYTVEAVHTTSGTAPLITKTYTGNYWGRVEKTFNIVKLRFAIKADDKSKAFGATDPALTVKTVNPDDTDQDVILPDDLQLSNILKQNTDNSYYHVTRVPGEHVGAYVISVTDAVLKASDPAAVSDPAHNFDLVRLIPGAFTIVKAEGLYYVSSKKVVKEYDGTADVNGADNKYFNGYYLYRRIAPGNQPAAFQEILPEDPVYSLIAGPTSNVLNDNRTGAGRDVYWSNGAGSAIYSWNILPNVEGLGTDEYTLATIDLHAGSGEHDGEGYLQVNPKTVFLVANNQTSVYGEALVVPTTSDVTIYGYKLEGLNNDQRVKVIDKDQVLTGLTLNFRAPVVTDVNNAPGEVPYTFENAINVPTQWTTGWNGQTVAQANPNYDIKLVPGNYTITAPTQAITVAVTWTKTYGQADTEATATYVINHPNKPSYTLANNEIPTFNRGVGAPEAVNTDGYVLTATQMDVPEKLDGQYDAVFTGKLVILPLGEVQIALSNQTINYDGADAVTSLIQPYASVTGLTADQIADFGLTISYAKPETGFVKKGAKLQVKCGDVLVGDPGDGHVVTAAEWPWVANFEKVTVKSANLYVNGADEITLDMFAFNKASYTAATGVDANATDQLIRDYDGTKVTKVNIKSTLQQFEVQPDNWYTMVLPFATTPRQISEFFNGYAAIDILSDRPAAKASEILFKLTMQPLDANTPFILKTDTKFTFGVESYFLDQEDGFLIQYPELDEEGNWVNVPVDGSGNKFIGTYKPIVGFEPGKYDIINLAGNVNPAAANTYLRALGAYIQVGEDVNNAAVRVYIEEPDGTITAINGVEAENGANAEGVYNLSGQRVSRAQRGIYIKDGKKVLVK